MHNCYTNWIALKLNVSNQFEDKEILHGTVTGAMIFAIKEKEKSYVHIDFETFF